MNFIFIYKINTNIFIFNYPYITVHFLGVIVQLAMRVTIRQTSLGIQLGTLTGHHFLF